MIHRIEISKYEARELERRGITVHSFDSEDSYGHRFWVTEADYYRGDNRTASVKARRPA